MVGLKRSRKWKNGNDPPSAFSFEVTHSSECRLCFTEAEASWQRSEWIAGSTASRQCRYPPPTNHTHTHTLGTHHTANSSLPRRVSRAATVQAAALRLQEALLFGLSDSAGAAACRLLLKPLHCVFFTSSIRLGPSETQAIIH